MARKRTSPFEDFLEMISKLPWWVCIVLAIISYPVLHGIVSAPAVTVKNPNQFGAAAAQGVMTVLASLGQYVLPFIFIIAAVVSAANSISQKNYTKELSHALILPP